LIVTDAKRVHDYVAPLIPGYFGKFSLVCSYHAIGIEKDGKLIAGCLYYNFRENGLEMTFAATNKRWPTRKNLKTFFDYPFEQLGLQRVTALIRRDNKQSIDMVKRLGYRLEGICRKTFSDNCDAVIFGMLKNECKWIEVK